MATRRTVLKLLATAGLAPAVVSAQGAAKVVVVGGGFAGAACARALRKLDANLQVTLVTGAASFSACAVQQLGDRRPARAGAAGVHLRRRRRGWRDGGDRAGRVGRSGDEDGHARAAATSSPTTGW